MLTFNRDSKMIGYYNSELPGGKPKNGESLFSKYKALFIPDINEKDLTNNFESREDTNLFHLQFDLEEFG